MIRFKGMLRLIILFVAISTYASNRADINGDRSVDATDIAILGNLLAGNLDMMAYDLPHIVMVAKQGGDFWSISMAMNWVRTQAPSKTNRFLVYVAPGEYLVNRYNRILVPSYTTLRGASREQTHIIGDNNSGANYAPVECDTVENVAIENLTIRNEYDEGQSGWTTGLHIEDCTGVVIRNCRIETVGKHTISTGIFIDASGANTVVEIVDCEVFCEHEAPGLGRAMGICVYSSSNAVIRKTDVYVDQYLATDDAHCIAQYASSSDNYFIKAYSCGLYPTSSSGVARFFNRTSQGKAYFYGTEVSGTSSTTSSDIWFINCHTETAAWP